MSRLKFYFLLLFSFSLLWSGPSGLGIILGEPTGLSVKIWQNDNIAYDAAAAWSLGEDGALHLHADFLQHNYNLLNQDFPVYYGLGGRVRLEDDPKLGVRIPLGISHKFSETPMDIFFEIVPVLDLVPETSFAMNGAIGIRYYFFK
jgi:hypothetical protein